MKYEIIHDHFARLIEEQSGLGRKEQEFRNIRNQLRLSAINYAHTGSLLDKQEMVKLYLHRERVASLTPGESRLLMFSCLAGNGPAWYWHNSMTLYDFKSLCYEAMKAPLPALRSEAASAFTNLASREDLPRLREMLGDEYWRVRQAAVEGIAKLGSREDLPGLWEMLKDEDLDVCQAAVVGISKLGSRDDLPRLWEIVKDKNWDVRQTAVEGIAKLNSRKDLPRLWKMLKDKDWRIRQAAVEGIAKLVSREDLPRLRELLKDENWSVRQAAVEGIAKLASRKDLPRLWKMLKDEDSDVRQAAAEGIAKLGGEEDLSHLTELAAGQAIPSEEIISALIKLDRRLYCPFPELKEVEEETDN